MRAESEARGLRRGGSAAGVGLCLVLAIGCGAMRATDEPHGDAPAPAEVAAARPRLPADIQPGIDVTKAPDWWLTRPAEIRAFLERLPGVEVKEIGRTAGNRPIIAAEWGQADSTRPGLLFVGAAHGTEFEGTVAMLNFLNIVVTGKDLTGRDQPAMAEAGRKFRLQVIPILNVDGRERFVDHVQWIGVNSKYFYMVTQGLFKDGRVLPYEESRRYQPMTHEEFEFFGSYRNDAGYNPVREGTDETTLQPENRALLRYVRQAKPDAVIFSHSNAGSLVTAGVSRTIPADFREHLAELKYRIELRCHESGFARYRTAPTRPAPRAGSRPPQPFSGDRVFYHTDHAYQACGLLPIHVEFAEGWDAVPDNHLELLDIGLTVIDETCRYIVERGVRAKPPEAASD